MEQADRRMSGAHPFDRHCPKCGAPAKVPCQGRRGNRRTFHRERWRGPNFHSVPGDGDENVESPIELKLVQAIRGWLEHHEIRFIRVETQKRLGPYRPDILLTDTAVEDHFLVVECDGRDWHTKEHQVDRDKMRDRWFAARSIPVMRFTGSEIHRDARGCAAQIGSWVVCE